MPFKPIYRPFRPPTLRTPSFLPDPIYAESEIPEADPGLQGPPPALQSPEVRINAPAPPKQKTFSERFREEVERQPEPITGFRRGASAFLSGGIPGLASELINPSAKREKHQMNVDNLIAEQKINSQERQDETNDMYKRSLADDIKARGEDRNQRRADADLERERRIVNDEWEEYSGPPEMTAPGEQPMFQYATIGGKKMRRPTEFAKAKAKKDAELSTHREVPAAIAKELGLAPGTKVAPNELDSYVKMVEAKAARTANEQLRRDLATEAIQASRERQEMMASTRQAMAANRGSQADFRNTMQMGNAYKAEPAVKSLYEVKQAYDGMRSAGNDGAADLTLLRYFAKITDPSTGVREGEYAEMAKAGGVKNAMDLFLSGKWTTGNRLTPQTRAAFLRIAEQLVKNREKAVSETQDVYRRRATKFGVDPRDVFDDAPTGPPALSTPGGNVEMWERDANGKLRRKQ